MTARSTLHGTLAVLAIAGAAVTLPAGAMLPGPTVLPAPTHTPTAALSEAGTVPRAPMLLAVASERVAIVLAGSRMSIDQAVKMAEQKFKARVVRAESQDQGGKVVYVLRLLNDSGRVWTVRVDAATGSVI